MLIDINYVLAERILSARFGDVISFPHNTPGFDYVCDDVLKIDVKTASLDRDGWRFTIRRNAIADFFLCFAYYDLGNHTPLYAWLIPGDVVQHRTCACVAPNTVDKWSEYWISVM